MLPVPTPVVSTPKRYRVPALLAVAAACLVAYAAVRLVPKRSAPVELTLDQDVIRLTNNIAADGQPDWSPDGSQVVFVSNRDGLPSIWVMRADGVNPRNLTASLGRTDSPSWSPDGKRIAFQRKRGNRRKQSSGAGCVRRESFVGAEFIANRIPVL